jgi:hypothetical protein
MPADTRLLLQSVAFRISLLIGASLGFLWWGLVPSPSFPTVSLAEFQLSYYFPLIGFIPAFWLLFFGKKRLTAAWLLGIVPLLWLLNLNLLRPDFYFFWLFLLVWALAADEEQRAAGWLLLCAAMYLWTGAHKINPGYTEGLGMMFKKRQLSGIVTLIIPVLVVVWELTLGLTLIFRKNVLRRILGIGLHAGILLFLFIGNWNRAMIPWNVGLLLMHILIAAPAEEFSASKIIRSGISVPLFLAWIMPALSYVGLWPHAFSWDMYSGRAENYYLLIDEHTALHPPDYLREHIFRKDGVYFVGISQWCEAETGGAPLREPALKNRLLITAEKYIRENPR